MDKMKKNLLSLERWDTLTASESECEAVGRELSQHLPAPWQFTGVRRFQGDQNSHYIAFFDWNGAAFALIPGGEATLGYDRNNPFVLNEAQEEEWRRAMKDSVEITTFDKYANKTMTPLRRVAIEPFLIEVRTKMFGIKEQQNGRLIIERINKSEITYKVRKVSHRDTLQIISRDGFRFPTSDEWEYACAAGCRTLWHWGNEYPLHCYPKECKNWNLNLKPNAFGLEIANYPYNWEFCAEPGIMRGGDGGVTMYGGGGRTMVWLCLASAFFQVKPEDDTQKHFGVHLRRVYSIPKDLD